MEKTKSIFATLNAVNVAMDKKDKQGLSYLPWSKAWEILKQNYPDASYEVERFDNKPWQYDENLGYMIHTSVTIEGVTQKMFLPVMDSKNQAMKSQPYTYTTGYGDKKKVNTVDAATMRDISDATMRCLVKNIALFGLGLNFYYGEDISKEAAEEMKREQNEQIITSILKQIEKCETVEKLQEYTKTLNGWENEDHIRVAIIDRIKEINGTA